MVQCNPFEFLTIAMPDTQNETWRQQFQIEFKRRNKIIRFSSLIACHMSRALMCLWRHVYDRVVSRNKWAILIFFFWRRRAGFYEQNPRSIRASNLCVYIWHLITKKNKFCFGISVFRPSKLQSLLANNRYLLRYFASRDIQNIRNTDTRVFSSHRFLFAIHRFQNDT